MSILWTKTPKTSLDLGLIYKIILRQSFVKRRGGSIILGNVSSREFSRKEMEARKDKVIEVVLLVCDKYHLPVPEINFKGCPEETDDQLAHYHPDNNRICISEFQLNKLKTIESIEQTTYHELAHIIEPRHNGRFDNMRNTFSVGVWRPPPGVMYIDGSAKPAERNVGPPMKERIIKSICNYPNCSIKSNLSKCEYCKRYYCQYHIAVIIPGTNVPGNNYHACPKYSDYMRAEKERKSREYTRALDMAKGKITRPVSAYNSKEDSSKKSGISDKEIGTSNEGVSDEQSEEVTNQRNESGARKKGIFDRIREALGIGE